MDSLPHAVSKHAPFLIVDELPEDDDKDPFLNFFIVEDDQDEKNFRVRCALVNHASEFGYGKKVVHFKLCRQKKEGIIRFEPFDVYQNDDGFSSEVQHVLRKMHESCVWHGFPSFVRQSGELRIDTNWMWPMFGKDRKTVPRKYMCFDIAWVLHSWGKTEVEKAYVDCICENGKERNGLIRDVQSQLNVLCNTTQVQPMIDLIVEAVKETPKELIQHMGANFLISLARERLQPEDKISKIWDTSEKIKFKGYRKGDRKFEDFMTQIQARFELEEKIE
jgi:hypothetical protein